MSKLIVGALALSLTGCFMVGPDYEKPKIEAPAQWRFAAEDARETANLPWWEQLHDPVLNQLVEQALMNNLDLKVAIANVEQFMGLYGATRASLFPQIFGQAGYDRRQPSGEAMGFGGKVPDTDAAQLGATMFWELDVWGQLRRAKEAAGADLLAQEAARNAVVLTLVSTVAQTYIVLRALDRRLEITRQTVDSLVEENRIAKARFDMGYSSEIEVSQSTSELERRRAQIPAFEQQIAQTEHALSLLLGKPPGAIDRGLSLDELSPPPVPAGLPSEQLIRRPDIQQAEQNLIAANARIGVARGEYFPKVSLTGDIGQASMEVAQLFVPGANFWTIGSRLLGPIFTAGRVAGQVQAAEAGQQAALASYQRAILAAFSEFEDGLVARTKSNEQQSAQARRVEALENYLRLSRIRYDEGYTSYLEVLDALRQYYEGQIELVQARSDTFVALIQLYRAMGGGWIVEAEQKAQVPKPKEASFFP
ncbi:efflux transporter outer membrane subunit [Methylicorpusculum sp.]|uniref:efflux transporter outer membrane subunit n=1 Tax=Methylicorpusculum sp. TaxID=2713644 RepID=UPI002722001C|nr:efflux transporter outer membrane subunit [Methylicorpusculum sp.]MDO9241173.1 efflux transporter outer membrane subunit [Methylicorpusculum sp.]MDP2179923.1 efflux transporter outer membrane subunit [Methylicorpusculum sp.]MDP3528364.1 efflux transporter outer membrane subunit [Methylicorpusculum sp.]MDZ4154158.1 efflux transporter outer membrane subunit [Methylicorpusculum sp.]